MPAIFCFRGALDVGHAHAVQEGIGTDLNAVAKSHGVDGGVSLHVARQRSHGVGVVEEPGVGTDLSHIVCEILKNGDGAQGAEDTANAQGVCYGLAEAVLLGHLKINDGAGVVQAHLNGVYHEICPTESILALGHAQVLGDLGAVLVDVLVQCGDHDVGFFQSLGVNVVKSKFEIPKRLATHGVADNVFGKNGAARTHERDLSHFQYPSPRG